MNKLSLFSGIGGDDLASDWAGFTTVAFVEKEPYCQKVLRKHWPEVPIIEDVKDVTRERIAQIMADTESGKSGEQTESEGWQDTGRGSEEENGSYPKSNGLERRWMARTLPSRQPSGLCKEPITLISGGFPCQPHSVAGVRKGSTDERNLWPEFRRIIGEIQPRWVLAENVPGLFTSDARRFFGTILADLAEMGYSAGWATYGAVDVGAPHRRYRVFIVGYSKHAGQFEPQVREGVMEGSDRRPAEQEQAGKSEGPDKQQGSLGQFPQKGLQDVAHSQGDRTTEGRCQLNKTGRESDVADTQQSVSRGRQPIGDSRDSGRGEAEAESESLQSTNRESYPSDIKQGGEVLADTDRERLQGHGGLRECGGQWLTWQGGEPLKGIWEFEPDVGRVAHGIPSRVDRLKGLGNAVVPQQVYPIYKAIADIENYMEVK